MNTLNDDCQLLIIKHLDFYDQLSLFDATNGEPANRLNSNVRYIWQHRPCFNLDDGQFTDKTKSPALMDNFLSIISPTVQALSLYWLTFESLKRFAPYKFPKVTDLEYSLDTDEAKCNGDLFINLVVELFPALTSFKPCGVVKWIHLKNWMNLRELDLSECWPLEDDGCELEIEIAELKMLEELTTVHHCYDNVSSALMRLTKFRKFTYFLCQKNIDFPVGCRIKDIVKLTFNDSIHMIHRSSFKELINLRQLSILDNSMLGNKDLTSSELIEHLTDIPQLERLDLINVQIWGLETELWKTVACCPYLKILNISSMQLEETFFYRSRRPMKRVLDKRSIPLTLHCHDTGGYEHLIRSYFKHPKLEVSFEPLEFNYIENNFIEIHFLPLQIATEEEDSR